MGLQRFRSSEEKLSSAQCEGNQDLRGILYLSHVSTLPNVEAVLNVSRRLPGRHVQAGHMGMSQNSTTRGPQVLVLISTYQGSILGLPYF